MEGVEPANRRIVVPIGRVAIVDLSQSEPLLDWLSDGTSSISVMSRLSFYSALSLQQPNCQWRYDGIPRPSSAADAFISLALERNPMWTYLTKPHSSRKLSLSRYRNGLILSES